MLMTTHDNPTDAGGRLGVRGGFAPSCAAGDRMGMHDHDRPSGPETMR